MARDNPDANRRCSKIIREGFDDSFVGKAMDWWLFHRNDKFGIALARQTDLNDFFFVRAGLGFDIYSHILEQKHSNILQNIGVLYVKIKPCTHRVDITKHRNTAKIAAISGFDDSKFLKKK